MNRNNFIHKLAYTTESSNKPIWQRISHPFDDYPSYQMEGKNGMKVELRQFNVSHYEDDGSVSASPEVVAELKDEADLNLGYIYGRELNDPSEMHKLYHIAEMNANDVDKLTDEFFDD